MKRIYLIDCPGIVPPSQHDTPEDILLRGVVRVENVENPEQYIPAVLAKVKKHHMERTYELKDWKDHIHFLELLARKGGRLLKGGEPDVDGVAKMVLMDFMRGKIPWFTPPPSMEGGPSETDIRAGREGRLGEMPKKRKRDDLDSIPDISAGTVTPVEAGKDVDDSSAEASDFEGFGDDGDNASESSASGEDVIPLEFSSDEDEEDGSGESGSDADDGPEAKLTAISGGAPNAKRQRR